MAGRHSDRASEGHSRAATPHQGKRVAAVSPLCSDPVSSLRATQRGLALPAFGFPSHSPAGQESPAAVGLAPSGGQLLFHDATLPRDAAGNPLAPFMMVPGAPRLVAAPLSLPSSTAVATPGQPPQLGTPPVQLHMAPGIVPDAS